MEVYLSKSNVQHKKWSIFIPEKNKTIQFGDSAYADYTTHKDAARKARYLQRHQARELWFNPFTAGFWSRWLLWNKPTLAGSIADIHQRFHIRVIRSSSARDPESPSAAKFERCVQAVKERSPQYNPWAVCHAALSGRRRRRSRRYSGSRKFSN